VLKRRAARRYDAESLALAGKLLELHPEVYTVWNYRREALTPVRRACFGAR
jgi:geranylgeranyl transferase type-2 subunit alpha